MIQLDNKIVNRTNMYYIDVKFLNIISDRLEKFKRKSENLWNCRCPQCGDISKNKVHTRGYFYHHSGKLLYKCHHCSYSVSFNNFLKNFDNITYREYINEKFTNKEEIKSFNFTPVEYKPTPQINDILNEIDRLDLLVINHPVVEYLNKRMIPKKRHNLFYVAYNFMEFINKVNPDKFTNISNDYPRLIIPFFDKDNNLIGLQARAFGSETPKYITIKINETCDKIFGLERLDITKHFYVVEGAIDSIFLPNTIAVNGASFDIDFIRSNKDNCTLIVDNEPRNREIVKIISRYIDNNYKICIMPKEIIGKDINEYILNGYSIDYIIDIINQNSFRGLEAKLVFNKWKQVEIKSHYN